MVQVFIHFLNGVLPGLAVGVLTASLAKVVWHHELRAVRWSRLARWGAAAGVGALLGGVAMTGRDGTMLSYGLVIVACAAAVAWAAWGGTAGSPSDGDSD